MSTEAYLRAQREFWNVDEHTARFGRVDTVSRSEQEYEQLADRDIDLVLEGITPQPGWTIVELGCGVGRLISRLFQRVRGVRVIGVDISENMIRYARMALSDEAGDIRFHVNNGADLSMIAGSTINFIYSNDVLIHVHDVEIVRSYFREISRVLVSDGLFRFNVRRMDINASFSNSPGGLIAKAGYLTGALSPLSRAGLQAGFSGIHYRRRDIRKIAAAAGLRVASMQDFGGPEEKKLWCTCAKS